MKIVAFAGQGGSRLGVVEGDQVIDLQAADAKAPTDLGEWLKANNGDLKPLAESPNAHRRARASRFPGLNYALPVGRPGKIFVPRIELPRARQGRRPARQHSKISDHFHARPDFAGAARPADRPAASYRDARLRSRDDPRHRQARQAFDRRQRLVLRRRLFLRQRRLGARIPAQDHAMGHGQELRPHRRLWPVAGFRRRTAARRQRPEDRDAGSTARSCSRTIPTT